MEELKILYLEDSAQDAEMTARILKKAGINFTFKLVDNRDEYEDALKEFYPDLVLADHSLFHFNSNEALRIFKRFNYKIPFILVTGTVSEEFAVNILKEGADDYLLKDNLSRLPKAIANALEKFRIDQERLQHLENVLANEAMLRQAEELANIGSWQIDLSSKKVSWSDEMYRLYGYEPGEIEPDSEVFLKHIHNADQQLFRSALDKVLKDADKADPQFRIIDKNGKLKFIHSRISLRADPDGNPNLLVGFNQDITDRKISEQKLLDSIQQLGKLEKALMENQLNQQKLITEITIQAQEKERNELSKELHDNINQVLATVKMLLNLAKENEEVREEMVSRSYENINYAIEEIRKLSRSLVAPSLGDMGIQEAVGGLLEDINTVNPFHIQFEYNNPKNKQLDPGIELMIYRIVQEQLNNIIKYSQAGNVNILMDITDNNIKLNIEDDGVGFDTSQKASGIGLKNISSRVSFYSGEMKIESSPGMGCKLKINIPV